MESCMRLPDFNSGLTPCPKIPRSADSPKRPERPKCQEFKAFPGINLITLNLPVGTAFSADFVKEDQVFEFAYILKGKAQAFIHERSSASIEIAPRTAVTHYLHKVPATFEVAPEPDIQMLGIEVRLEVLRQMLAEDEGSCPKLARFLEYGSATHFFEFSGMQTLLAAVADQILSCSFTGLTRSLFLRSKVLEFLSIQLEALKTDGTAQFQGVLTQDEEQQIRDARKLLNSRMTDVPTLAELSDITGLSLTKLKKGFKLVFGKTAHACLHEDRMERAHTLLTQRRMNVSEVAWEIGYINVGHFSTAFRKQFGIRPKEFQMSGFY